MRQLFPVAGGIFFRLPIWALVDALTRLSSKLEFARDRTDADPKAAGLLALAA